MTSSDVAGESCLCRLFPDKEQPDEQQYHCGDEKISRRHPPATDGWRTIRREDGMSKPVDSKADHRWQRQEYVPAGQCARYQV